MDENLREVKLIIDTTEAIVPNVSFTINLKIINKYGGIINEVLRDCLIKCSYYNIQLNFGG